MSDEYHRELEAECEKLEAQAEQLQAERDELAMENAAFDAEVSRLREALDLMSELERDYVTRQYHLRVVESQGAEIKRLREALAELTAHFDTDQLPPEAQDRLDAALSASQGEGNG